MTTPAERLSSRSWRLRNSLWMVPVILLAGIATWASFLYIGLKAKRKSWLVAAGIFGAGALLIFTPLVIIVWIGGIVYAAKSNREWLEWKAHAQPAAAWDANGATQVAAAPGEPLIDDVLLGRAADTQAPPAPPPWMAPRPQVPTAGPPPPPAFGTAAPSTRTASLSTAPLGGQGAGSSRLVDVNAASVADLEGELGLERAVAERVIAERARIGRFAEVEQLMTLAGVAPHVFAAIRHRATVGLAPGPSDPSARGRRLDL